MITRVGKVDSLGDELRAAPLHDGPYWAGTAPFQYDSLVLAQHVSSRTDESRQSCPAHLACAL
jgi:hypothetical protein